MLRCCREAPAELDAAVLMIANLMPALPIETRGFPQVMTAVTHHAGRMAAKALVNNRAVDCAQPIKDAPPSAEEKETVRTTFFGIP